MRRSNYHFAYLLLAWLSLAVGLVSMGCESTGTAAKDPHASVGLHGRLPAKAAIDHPMDFSGKWIGAILVYPKVVYVQMELTPRGVRNGETVYSGTSGFQQRESYRPGREIENDVTVELARVELRYQENTQTFVIEMARNGRSRGNYVHWFRKGEGVVDLAGNRFAGTRGDRNPSSLQDYFYFVRPHQFEEISDNYGHFYQPPGRTSLLARFMKASKADLIAWFEPFAESYPEADLYHIPHGKLELMVIDLFNDAHFKRHFGGKTFDELGAAALDGTAYLLSRDMIRSRDRNERSLGVLGGMFSRTIGSPRGMDTLQGVFVLRAFDGWYSNQMALLAGMQASEANWEGLTSMEPHFEPQSRALSMFLPARSQQAKQNILETRQRLAYPIIQASIAELEKRLHQPSTDVLADVVSWPVARRERLSYLSASQRAEVSQRIESLKFRLVKELMPSFMERLRNLGQGFEAVLGGNDWYHSFTGTFQGATDAPAYMAAYDAFLQRRAIDLEAARPAMLAKISTLAYKELNAPTRYWLTSPSDRSSPVYPALVEAATQRKAELERQHELSIKTAVAQAFEESRKNPSQPLRYIDMRKYAVPELMSMIYYGTMDFANIHEVLGSFKRGDLQSLFKSAEFTAKMKIVFQEYHRTYYERYGSTADKRRQNPEGWVPMEITHKSWQEDGFGNRSNESSSTSFDIYVRQPYVQAYKNTLATTADVLAMLVGAARERRIDSDAGVWGVLGGMIGDTMKNRNAFDQFLSDYHDSYPATVRHFEQNLLKAFTRREMIQLDLIEVEPLK